MTAASAGRPPRSRWLSRLIGAVLVGWLVVYNVMRLAGSSPADAAWPSLAIGAAAALVLVGLGTLAMRPPAASGRVLPTPGRPRSPRPPGAPTTPSATRSPSPGRPSAALAIAALAVGAYLADRWFSATTAGRAATVLILAAWNVLVGLWLGDEAIRSRRGEADGLDSAVLGCILTAVLAAVGFSRDLASRRRWC